MIKRVWQWVRETWERCGSDPEYLAQLAHIGWGGFLALALALRLPIVEAAVVAAVLAVLKELSEYWTETGETRGSTLLDILFWCVGIAAATIILELVKQ
jgi:pimeloyl-ACP methyl ester carboxylesterase